MIKKAEVARALAEWTLYDVCGDYSLDSNVSEQSRATAHRPQAYGWYVREVDGQKAYTGYCRKTDELHYLLSPDSGLSGKFI